MNECTTHHNACDCREAKFRELEAENERYRKALQDIYDTAAKGDGTAIECAMAYFADEALKEPKK